MLACDLVPAKLDMSVVRASDICLLASVSLCLSMWTNVWPPRAFCTVALAGLLAVPAPRRTGAQKGVVITRVCSGTMARMNCPVGFVVSERGPKLV